MTDPHTENTPQEGDLAAADLARHADPKPRSADWSGFEALPPFIGDILQGSDGARESLLLLLTLRTDVEESETVYARQQREVAADQAAIVDAAIRRALKLDENAPVGDEERKRVTGLRLKNHPVDDDGLRLLAGLSALKLLNLDGTVVTDAGLEHLATLVNLQTLYLYETSITDVGLERLTSLVNLNKLYMSKTSITDAGLEHLASRANLQVLFLGSTSITDVGLEHLASLVNLNELFMSKTSITDAGLAHLATLTNLQTLWIEDTQVTDAGVARLKVALPKCKFVR